MSIILEVKDLKKTFGSVTAVNGLSFSIPRGVCFGLLGPNGAGKTTSIEMMEGILAPDSGTILFNGLPIDRRFRERVGIQFQSTALPEFITVKETLELFSSFYPNPRPLDDVIRLCSLQDILKRDNQKLSGGQRQRLLLGIAIIPKPELIFLDEPTTGLDPQARRNFWDLIRGIREEGATIVLTTHYMDEAQILCDVVAIMDHGKLLELDTPESLLDKHFSGAIIKLPAQEGKDYQEIISNDIDGTLKELLSKNFNLQGLSIHKPNLEDLFIKLTGNSLRT